MSAFLKQLAPLGSLNADVVNPPPKSEDATKDVAAVSRGWRIQNFNSASTKLLDAASRLETEVASESRYWDEVLAVKEKGWKVCRLPQNRQALGVQYGFLEATPAFRDRGLASLRRSENGKLVLDKGLIPTGSRFVRVRVRQGQHVFTSSRPSTQTSSDPDSVEYQILQARDSVFEEELFHELVREARAMASSGVTTRQDHICVPASDDLEVLLDLVDANDARDETDQNSSNPDHLLAHGLAHSIRILLAFSHRQNLRRRTQIPVPLTNRKRPNLEYPLLRPALAYFQHLSQVRWLESFLRDIYGVLEASGLKTPGFTANTFINESVKHTVTSESNLETLLQSSLLPVKSVFRGKLIGSGSFDITIRTTFLAPPFGTAYNVTLGPPAPYGLKPPGILSLRSEVEAAITHTLLLDVIQSLSSQKQAAEDKKSSSSESPSWEATYPHLGELTFTPNPGQFKKMKVSLSRHELSLSVSKMQKFDGLAHVEAESEQPAPNAWTCHASEAPKEPSIVKFAASQAS